MRALGVAELAIGAFGAYACEVFRARLLACVTVSTALPVLTEAPCIPWALSLLLLGPHMQKDALLIATLAKVGEIPAFGHAVVIKAVQEITVVALLA